MLIVIILSLVFTPYIYFLLSPEYIGWRFYVSTQFVYVHVLYAVPKNHSFDNCLCSSGISHNTAAHKKSRTFLRKINLWFYFFVQTCYLPLMVTGIDTLGAAEKKFTSGVSGGTETRPRDFFALLKPRVMSLVVFTGFAGMWCAPGFSQMHPLLICVAMLSLALGAGAAGAINMWYDRDIDKVMQRTKARPIPAGRVSAEDALAFALILSVFSVMTMGLAVNWAAAGLLAFANFFYSVIYTMGLKRHTAQNIVIGGAAGAFPPMIGWAAVTGNYTLEGFVLFLIIFLWTPPHFWALSLFANSDYARAKIPMLTVTAGARTTKIHMLAYTLILFPVSLLPWFMGFASWVYAISAVLLSGLFIISAIRTYFDSELKSARIMFTYSIFYLFALFFALMVGA
jgi:heme o synthase